ncbi:hypothetical protein BJY01DRAFT_244886 [Aspergillus pseudoustus]|uniref:Uncharacterized protein n=1 Tax=Aspergillus pseudoustus TaxID=1810923 RepID=A0ABR4KHM9_9EURO
MATTKLTAGEEYRLYRAGVDLTLSNTANINANANARSGWWGFAENLTQKSLHMMHGELDECLRFNWFVLVEPLEDTSTERDRFRPVARHEVGAIWNTDQGFLPNGQRMFPLGCPPPHLKPKEGDIVRGFWQERQPVGPAGCRDVPLRVGVGRVTEVIEDYGFCFVLPRDGGADGAVASWFFGQTGLEPGRV